MRGASLLASSSHSRLPPNLLIWLLAKKYKIKIKSFGSVRTFIRILLFLSRTPHSCNRWQQAEKTRKELCQ